MSFLTEGWVVVGHTANNSFDKIYDKLRSHGIKPKEFLLYGDIRTFIRANDLPENEALAFHKGYYVGPLDMIDHYIEATKGE